MKKPSRRPIRSRQLSDSIRLELIERPDNTKVLATDQDTVFSVVRYRNGQLDAVLSNDSTKADAVKTFHEVAAVERAKVRAY